MNGSDCGIFVVVFVICFVFEFNFLDFMFDILRMRLYLFECLRVGEIKVFLYFWIYFILKMLFCCFMLILRVVVIKKKKFKKNNEFKLF